MRLYDMLYTLVDRIPLTFAGGVSQCGVNYVASIFFQTHTSTKLAFGCGAASAVSIFLVDDAFTCLGYEGEGQNKYYLLLSAGAVASFATAYFAGSDGVPCIYAAGMSVISSMAIEVLLAAVLDRFCPGDQDIELRLSTLDYKAKSWIWEKMQNFHSASSRLGYAVINNFTPLGKRLPINKEEEAH